ncbi:MAG TPA: DUF2007 domain-containing protein [Marinagarivorans sp.]
MKLIYSQQNALLVENAKSLLESENIEVRLGNEHLAGGAGELAPTDCWLELWVVNDKDFERADALIKTLTTSEVLDDWICLNCGEKNYPSFKLCWNCQHKVS